MLGLDFLLVVASCTIASAAPAGSFASLSGRDAAANLSRIIAKPNPNFQRNGLKEYLHAMQKFGFKPTKPGPYFVRDGMLRRAVDAGTGDEPAVSTSHDSEWLCEVPIGTPAQTLNLDFDTGSADLWVWSTQLSSSTQKQGASHTIFNPSKSSTFKTLSGETWSITYGDGSSASGTVGTDNINLGGIVVKKQAIELAKKLSSEFVSDSSDGLLGLAFDNINTVQPTPVATPMDNMISEGLIPSNAELFTAHLSSYKDASSQSYYTFGYLDQSALAEGGASSPYYTSVDNSGGFWQFASASASVNGKTVSRSGNTAIADTGTTLALVSDSLLTTIYAAIPGSKYDSTQQGYVFPTSTAISSLPVVKFAVGGKLFAVHKEDLAFQDLGNGYYYGGIQSSGSQGFDILGDTFLKGIYAVFNLGTTQFGAVQRPDPSS